MKKIKLTVIETVVSTFTVEVDDEFDPDDYDAVSELIEDFEEEADSYEVTGRFIDAEPA